MNKAIGLVLTALISLAAFALTAESVPDPDTESAVPELIAFHEVIAPMWHEAYPAKDTAALRALVPAIEAGMARINAARLSGILREKQAAWDKALAEFNQAAVEYRRAAAGSDEQALLAAAELLHLRFEMQVRSVRPPLREVDAYHRVLYVVYHKHLPEKRFADICALAPDLAAKAEVIAAAELPPRLSGRTEAFQTAAATLLAETRALRVAGATCAAKEITDRVGRVHDAYLGLEKVLE